MMARFYCILFFITVFPYHSLETSEVEDLSETTSGFADTFEKRCPPGHWCGKKRDISSQHKCHPTLGCVKEAVSTIESAKQNPKEVKVDNMAKTFNRRCPPGLWCGKKRQISNQEQIEDNDNQVSTDTFEKRCPPGLWCGKKRDIPDDGPITKERRSQSSIKVFEKRCPPGLWCGKKRESPEELPDETKEIEKAMDEVLNTFENRCPPGLWCGKKRAVSKRK